MGGFEGGDEAGFWESRRFDHAKTTGSKKERIEPLLQMGQKVFKVSFVENESGKGIDIKDEPLLYSVYKAIVDYTHDYDIVDFFDTHKVVLEETLDIIPKSQSSIPNEVILLHLMKDACSLVLTDDELNQIKKSNAAKFSVQ